MSTHNIGFHGVISISTFQLKKSTLSGAVDVQVDLSLCWLHKPV